MFRRSTDTRPSLIFQRIIWSLLSQAAGAHVTEYLMNSFSFRQSSSVWHKVSFYPPCLWKWELSVELGSGDEKTAEGRSQITSSDRHIGKNLLKNVRKLTDTDFFFFKLSSVTPWHRRHIQHSDLKYLRSTARSASKALTSKNVRCLQLNQVTSCSHPSRARRECESVGQLFAMYVLGPAAYVHVRRSLILCVAT